MTTRRAFLASAALVLAAARVGAQGRIHRMAMLLTTSPAVTAPLQRALFDRLGELGYRVGHNLVVERRYAQGRLDRLPALAGELVALKPDVLFAGSGQATLSAMRVTSTIQIVFVAVADPLGAGIVKSLQRPGANATGLSAAIVEIQAKRLQLLKEVFPSAVRVAVLRDPLNEIGIFPLAALKKAGRALGLALRTVDARSADELASAFDTLKAEPPDVLYVLESPLTLFRSARIVEFASGQRLPAVYGFHEFAEVGGLMSYSLSLREHYRGAASFIDKILKGARSAELPVEQPMRFELVLNLRTAKAQGTSFPPAVLLRADRVIE